MTEGRYAQRPVGQHRLCAHELREEEEEEGLLTNKSREFIRNHASPSIEDPQVVRVRKRAREGGRETERDRGEGEGDRERGREGEVL